MKYEIKRDNGTIVLSEEEASEIYLLKEREHIKEDFRSLLAEESFVNIDLSEDDLECCVDSFLRTRDKCDSYYDAYWFCIESAIEEEIKEKI